MHELGEIIIKDAPKTGSMAETPGILLLASIRKYDAIKMLSPKTPDRFRITDLWSVQPTCVAAKRAPTPNSQALVGNPKKAIRGYTSTRAKAHMKLSNVRIAIMSGSLII